MKLKTNQWLAVIWILILSLSISGCQLAKAESGSLEEDALIGAFITLEPLDMMDVEEYFQDHPESLSGEQLILNQADGYSKKIYAVLKDQNAAKPPAIDTRDPGDGLPVVKNQEYVFEDLEGIPFFAAQISGATPEDSYYASMTSEAVSNSHMDLNIGDDLETLSLDGTILFEPNREDAVFQINPVYQSADGRVYLTSGTSIGYAGHSGGEGEILAKTMESAVEFTENGVTKTRRHTIKVRFEAVFATHSLSLIEMDRDHRILAEHHLTPEKLPSEVRPGSRTEFVILEDHRLDENNQPNVKRRILDRGDGELRVNATTAHGYMIGKSVSLTWPSTTP